MPRVHHVKKARKDNPVCKKGGSYYWWKFRHGGKHFSLTYPKQSQLTQSPYLSVIYDCQDAWGELQDPAGVVASEWDRSYVVTWLGEIANSMESIAENLRELVDQYEESASNMEEYFSGSERIDNLRDAGSECEQTCDDIKTMMEEVRSTAEEIESLELPDKDDFDDEDEWQEACDGEVQDLIDALSIDEPNFDFHNL
jgi:hypothetical protein